MFYCLKGLQKCLTNYNGILKEVKNVNLDYL
jgi:hypothetical protein